MATIAVIFDFDDTLVPDSTSKLLAEMASTLPSSGEFTLRL
jgi:hypothetical protein